MHALQGNSELSTKSYPQCVVIHRDSLFPVDNLSALVSRETAFCLANSIVYFIH
jgi:hypothetical protein